ncbi:MAG: metal-sulfur cluster assembly factor [Patescibacteria group bacterium]
MPEKQRIVAALENVNDPEIGLNIVELGFIYRLQRMANIYQVEMTMTNPLCPLREYFRQSVIREINKALPDVSDVKVDFIFDPPWRKEMINNK